MELFNRLNKKVPRTCVLNVLLVWIMVIRICYPRILNSFPPMLTWLFDCVFCFWFFILCFCFFFCLIFSLFPPFNMSNPTWCDGSWLLVWYYCWWYVCWSGLLLLIVLCWRVYGPLLMLDWMVVLVCRGDPWTKNIKKPK